VRSAEQSAPSHGNLPTSINALVLAGRRGPDDPLARAAGAPHRALLDVGGVPMLERVVETLHAFPRIGRIAISIDEPRVLETAPGLAARIDGEPERLSVLASDTSPSRSVLRALETLPSDAPLLLTTADHALLDAAMLEHFLGACMTRDADFLLAIVDAVRLRQRFPESRRTYIHFRDASYSGANLFVLRTPAARRAVEFWTRAETFRKKPWRLAKAFGPTTLLRFVLRSLSLADALARASASIGAKIDAIEMPMAEAAVDVDRIEDLELVNRLV